jgi:hypothetical protein
MRAIVERRPELQYYCDDFAPARAFTEVTTPRESQLEAALRASVALRVQAERLIAAYVAPESDRAAIIKELIALFDDPSQREAQMLEAKALGEARQEHSPNVWPRMTLWAGRQDYGAGQN